jgi:gamma-glutamyl-gamma-aminobutyrate hydrolase PuuD
MRSVYVIGQSNMYNTMFEEEGWAIANSLDDADLVQFTGGADVSPSMYGEVRHAKTAPFTQRDEKEKRLWVQARRQCIPMAGVCRGGQFLNVMCGGSLYQHVDGHTNSHLVIDNNTAKMFYATSTHHQMMRPTTEAELLLVASEASRYEYMRDADYVVVTHPERGDDVEAVYYERQQCLCFQPHPEYVGPNDPCRVWYFNAIETYLFGGEQVCVD